MYVRRLLLQATLRRPLLRASDHLRLGLRDRLPMCRENISLAPCPGRSGDHRAACRHVLRVSHLITKATLLQDNQRRW